MFLFILQLFYKDTLLFRITAHFIHILMKNQQTDDRKKLIGDETRIVLLGILAATMWAKLPTFRYCMFFLFFISLQPNSISYKKYKYQGKMRRTVSTLLLLLFVVIAEAQNLTGKVIDSKTQEAIIGATVTLKGSKK